MERAATFLGEVNEEVPLSYTRAATSRPPRSSPALNKAWERPACHAPQGRQLVPTVKVQQQSYLSPTAHTALESVLQW